MEDVEVLVQQLYSPGAGSPAQIAGIQEALQKWQKSPSGWEMANRLLASHDEKVRFFGALTFTVKLNTDSDSLSEQDARLVLESIINWLIALLDQTAGPLVIRKLCSTLVVYFLKFSASWTTCIRHLMQSIASNRAIPVESTDMAMSIQNTAEILGPEKTATALWFATALAEEVGKTDGNNIKHHKFHDRLQLNVEDAVALIACGISTRQNGTQEATTKLCKDSLRCFHSWVLYSHRAFIDTGVLLEPLQTLTSRALACIVDETMYDVTIELFTDVLGNFSRFLSDHDLQILAELFNSDWSKSHYNRLIEGDFEFDAVQFGQFILAYADATVQKLARNNDAESQFILTSLENLLNAKGAAVADDLIFVQVLEFWATYVEVLVDSLYSEQDTDSDEQQQSKTTETAWFGAARGHVMKAIENCWRKIQFPPDHIFEDWDSVERVGFLDARADVADILQASYTLNGVSLFSMFATMTANALERGAWAELEASLFCMGALADCVHDDEESDSALTKIFGSSMLSVMADPSIPTSPRTRQTAITFIGQFDEYFERQPRHVPVALNFLFRALSSSAFASTASGSIKLICSACRKELVPELGPFLQNYAELNSTNNLEGLVKERVLGAIAAVVQAIPTKMDQMSPLLQLIQLVEADAQNCLELSQSIDRSELESQGSDVLRSLTSIAKGLQAPADVPLDLDELPAEQDNTFWTAGPGVVVQTHTLGLVGRLLTNFPESGDIIDAACSLLRAGFTEHAGGPFVFSPTSVAEFLVRSNLRTPRLGAVMSTACSFVSSHTASTNNEVNSALSVAIDWVFSLLGDLGEPSNDPEIAQNGLDFAHRLLSTHSNVFLEKPPQSLDNLFMFSLKAMAGKDPLPKFMAAEFWTSFITTSDLRYDLQSKVDTALVHYGPFLAQALIFNISGNAARSELDKISEPLKKFVIRQSQAKSWLEAALNNDAGMGGKVTDSEKRMFLQKIINLRGAKQTNMVVREFWLASRGSSFAYAS